MKVLHVAPSIAQSYGGPTQSLAGYANAAHAAGIEAWIFAPRSTQQDVDAFRSCAEHARIELFSSIGEGGFATSPTLIKEVYDEARSFDVVHVHGLFNPTSTLSARTAMARKAPTIIRPFGTLSRYTFEHRRTQLKRIYFDTLERQNITECAALHFTSDREKEEAAWHGVDLSERSFVVPPPASTPNSGSPRERSEHDSARVIFLGRINPIKNLESLLDAWPHVRAKRSDALLEIAGEGAPEYVAKLQKRAADLGIASSVAFRGFVTGERKEEFLRNAGIAVLPSHHENFGVAALEAIQNGVATIVSPQVHLGDFIQQQKVGVISGTEPASLSQAILDAIADAGMQRRVCENGAAIVERHFSAPAIGKLLSDMYQTAINRTHSPAAR